MKSHYLLLIAAFFVFIWSAISPNDRFAWVMLSLPAVIMVGIAVITYERFKFTTISYIMLFCHVVILLIGAKYTYTVNPVFEQLKDIFDFSRNHYDRVGHFAQGFFPIFFIKEFMIRKKIINKSKLNGVVYIAIVLAISASWELIEFAATVISGRPQAYVLSHQGDIWDTQWDIFFAFIGGITSLLVFGKYHTCEILIKMSEKTFKPYF